MYTNNSNISVPFALWAARTLFAMSSPTEGLADADAPLCSPRALQDASELQRVLLARHGIQETILRTFVEGHLVAEKVAGLVRKI